MSTLEIHLMRNFGGKLPTGSSLTQLIGVIKLLNFDKVSYTTMVLTF